jgi:Tfp pilus assembly PilM family ATPase
MPVLLARPLRAVRALLQVEVDAAVAAIPGDGVERRGIVVPEDLDLARVEGRVGARAAGVLPLQNS